MSRGTAVENAARMPARYAGRAFAGLTSKRSCRFRENLVGSGPRHPRPDRNHAARRRTGDAPELRRDGRHPRIDLDSFDVFRWHVVDIETASHHAVDEILWRAIVAAGVARESERGLAAH